MIILTSEQQIKAKVDFKTAHGNPASVDGAVEWSSSDASVVQVVPSQDTHAARVVALSPGNATVTVSADADLGPGQALITGSLDFQVIPAPAVEVVLTPGNPATRPLPGTMTGVTIQPDGSALVTFQGEPGLLYGVEASDAVTGPWAVIGQTTTDGAGDASFTDVDAPNHPSRFYRLI